MSDRISISNSQLGKHTDYPSHYAPELLFPIARAESRAKLSTPTPGFKGVDIWTAYELSWLDERGKPCVGMAEFVIPCTSPNIIESKSFKLYLNSFNQTRCAGTDDVRAKLVADLSAAAGAKVEVTLWALRACDREITSRWQGECIDGLPVTVERYTPDPDALATVLSGERVEETLYSDLLKSNCPVTGQPDWASVQIRYRGPRIEREGLLRYIISFREHQDFHEHCVERMFVDILTRCKPESLSIYARYTRRGGLDINPYRSTGAERPESVRLVRQ